MNAAVEKDRDALLAFVERVARNMSSDWPEHCIALVHDARRLLNARDAAMNPAPVNCGYPYCGGNAPECRTCRSPAR